MYSKCINSYILFEIIIGKMYQNTQPDLNENVYNIKIKEK